jgi:hypothetical protein
MVAVIGIAIFEVRGGCKRRRMDGLKRRKCADKMSRRLQSCQNMVIHVDILKRENP